MSTELKMTSLKEWICIKIRDKGIRYFEYNNFSNIEKIGEGAFGIVNKAYWNEGGIKVALKSPLNNSIIDENQKDNFLKELKILHLVNIHSNINQFLGVTKDQVHENYIIVLQYANQGNLREYLKKYFHSLQWKDMIRMALDITCGLKFLHSKQIIHRDLHAKNILVNNGSLMIADFGLSKHLAEIRSDSAVLGMPAYIDPQCFINNNYKRNEKSDIYSLGVLLWEISSGKAPFSEIPVFKIGLDIANGVRETPVNNTPIEYQRLYKNCWDELPSRRPDTEEVHKVLTQLLISYNDNILKNLRSQNDTHTLKEESLNNDDKDERGIISNALHEIIQAYLTRNNIGWTKNFDYYKILAKHYLISEKISKYLIDHSNIKHYEVIIGKFYEKGFGVEQNHKEAFKFYTKASEKNDVNGYFEVGTCYYQGNGIEKDKEKAIELYQLAANGGLKRAFYKLADHYMLTKNYCNSFEFSKTAAESVFIPSQFVVADRYNCGLGVQRNIRKALKWYKMYQENDGASDVSNKIKEIEEEIIELEKLEKDEIQPRKRIKLAFY